MATLHSNTCPICGRTFEWEGDTPPETCPFCFASISLEAEYSASDDTDNILDTFADEFAETIETSIGTDANEDTSFDDTEQFIKEMLGGFSDDSEDDLLEKIKQDILKEAAEQAVSSINSDSDVANTAVEATVLEEAKEETIASALHDAKDTSEEDTSMQPFADKQEDLSFMQQESADVFTENSDNQQNTEDDVFTALEQTDINAEADALIKDTAIEIDSEKKNLQSASPKDIQSAEDNSQILSAMDADTDISSEEESEEGTDILDIASIKELVAEESAIQNDVDDTMTEIDIFEALAQEAIQKDAGNADSTEESNRAVADVVDPFTPETPQPDIHNLAAAMQADGEPVRRRVVRRTMEEDTDGIEEAVRTPIRKQAPIEAIEARKKKRMKAQKQRGVFKYYIIAAVALIAVVLAGYFAFLKPMGHYNKGVSYAAEGENLLAISEFSKAGSYSDAKEKLSDALAPHLGQAMAFENYFAAEGKYAAIQNNLGQVYYANFETHTNPTVAQGDVNSFVLYKGFVVAVRANGGVGFSNLTTTDNPVPDLQGWETVQKLQILSSTLVGTKEDNTYVTSDNIDVSRLKAKDILSVNDTLGMFGVKKDGAVSVPNALEISTKKEAETLVDTVAKWKDIVLVEGTPTTRIVGLTKTGRVKVAPAISKDTSGSDKTASWRNIVDVATGQYHTVGLQADGTVVATGNNDYGQCNVSEWTDIIAIEAGNLFTIGVKKDGTVLVTSKTGSYIPVNFTDVYIPEPIVFEKATPTSDEADPEATASTGTPADADGTDADDGGTDATPSDTGDTGEGTDVPADGASPAPSTSTDAGE